jgi:hypothetical protein
MLDFGLLRDDRGGWGVQRTSESEFVQQRGGAIPSVGYGAVSRQIAKLAFFRPTP